MTRQSVDKSAGSGGSMMTRPALRSTVGTISAVKGTSVVSRLPGRADLEEVGGAVVEDRGDTAEGLAAGVADLQADQVGVVEFVIGQVEGSASRGA
jgi:hypothetical protein